MPSRQASHSGSWYSDSARTLARQLDAWLAQVPDTMEKVGSLPTPGARVIIAPHAGYSYSGPCAAYAYKALDLSKAKRIFILGPSHHVALATLALPTLTSYRTPLSDEPLPLDTELITQLLETQATKPNGAKISFTTMSRSVDEDEHSIEMHLPYIHRLLQLQYPDSPASEYPPLVPIMVGNTSASTEQAFGALLAPYLADPENAFISATGASGSATHTMSHMPPGQGPQLPLSGDILPQPGMDANSVDQVLEMVSAGHSLRQRDRISSREPAIHESISAFDMATMAAITTGSAKSFLGIIERTGNTVCGRHPIGVIMAALEIVTASQAADQEGRFYFLRYERSSDVEEIGDSSVSYVSAFAVL
ncbi:hypothetical protein HAV15_006174 [Penicillium sp. str. |nr:hypothetical protein HAV15_006174 [Penicillium sp. str. \